MEIQYVFFVLVIVNSVSFIAPKGITPIDERSQIWFHVEVLTHFAPPPGFNNHKTHDIFVLMQIREL